MVTALTRAVSRSLASCELTWLAPEPIDIALAVAQHERYEEALRRMGVRVISLPEQPDLPDAVFVEDPLIVVDEVAILTRMGAASRRPESASLDAAISRYRPVRRLSETGTLEGGDVMRVGRDLFAGLSGRTNAAGIEQLGRELGAFGYTVHAVKMRDCLHLKSACTSLGDGKILANSNWLDTDALAGYRIVEVAAEEPGAANILRVGDTVLMPDCFPRTREIVEAEGLRVLAIDISELMKAEAAITCSSVVFEADDQPTP